MRVLWISHFLPWPPTGHGALQRSHNLLVEVSRHHEVHLASLSPPSAHVTREELQEGVRQLESRVASVVALPMAADPYGIRRGSAAIAAAIGGAGYWDRRLWSPVLFERIQSLLRSRQFDLMHLDTIFLRRYLADGCPAVVLNHHNIESDLLRRRALMPSASPGWRWFMERQAHRTVADERAVARLADLNLVVSDLDRQRLNAIAGVVPSAIIPNGVDVHFFEPDSAISVDVDQLVFAGGMDWFPNREAMEYLASELWPALHADRPARRMTVIGRNPPAALRTAAAKDSSLRVAGFVPDVRPYLNAASIYLCPIRVGGGTRLKILDALAMAKALVSTSLGVEGLGLVDGEHYLRADSVAETVAQVRRLEADPVLRARIGLAGRKLVKERYSWQTIGRELSAAYERAGKKVGSLRNNLASDLS